MAFSRKKIALALITWSVAGFLAYQLHRTNRKPYTTIRSSGRIEFVSDDDRALEVAKLEDALRALGYSDGRGNRIEGGDWIRGKVRERQQTRLALSTGAVVLFILGLIAGLTARRTEQTIIFGVSGEDGRETNRQQGL